jgi:hypothetical protein
LTRKKQDQAFPFIEPPADIGYHAGMSIRDRFALVVIGSIYSNKDASKASPMENAQIAWDVADAMMETR